MNSSYVEYPRQIILVTSRAEIKIKFSPDTIHKDNIFTLCWHMPVSFDPPLYAIASGKKRYSTKLIKASKVFVVNFMPYALKDKILFCGSYSGEHMDKFKETGLIREKAETIDCPRIKQALGFLECQVIDQVDAGDHIIFIGKILNKKTNKQGKRLFQKAKGAFTTTK